MQWVGQKIKKARKEKGYSQQEFGDLIGLTRVSVMNIESGRHNPTVERLYMICCLLNLQPNDVFPPLKSLKAISVEKVVVIRKIKRQFKKVKL